ncbi:hypothetical protein T492DRAFT_846767 [Pavlovales sp. CCMP2436]|nr:hypothetical protein T492DRAFT_846767 [Pavlovales sp. CCMP2436]
MSSTTLQYDAPPTVEDQTARKERRRRMRIACTRADWLGDAVAVLSLSERADARQANLLEQRRDAEDELEARCAECDAKYNPAPENEADEERKKRRDRLRKRGEDGESDPAPRDVVDADLEARCAELGVDYQSAGEGEADDDRRKLLARLRNKCARALAHKLAESRRREDPHPHVDFASDWAMLDGRLEDRHLECAENKLEAEFEEAPPANSMPLRSPGRKGSTPRWKASCSRDRQRASVCSVMRTHRCYAKYDPPPPGETVLSGYIRRDGLIYRCNWVGRRLTLLDFQPSDSYFCPDDDDHLGSLAWKLAKAATPATGFLSTTQRNHSAAFTAVRMCGATKTPTALFMTPGFAPRGEAKYWVRTWRPMKYAYPLAWRWSPEFFVGRKPVIDIGRAPTPFYSDVSRPVRVRLRFTQTGATRCDSNYFDVDDECNARRMQRGFLSRRRDIDRAYAMHQRRFAAGEYSFNDNGLVVRDLRLGSEPRQNQLKFSQLEGVGFVSRVETQFPNVVSTTYRKQSDKRKYRCDPSTAQQIIDCYGRLGQPADSDAGSDSDGYTLTVEQRESIRELDAMARRINAAQ